MVQWAELSSVVLKKTGHYRHFVRFMEKEEEMNRLTISGRPTRVPGISYTGEGENQKAIAKFTIASNRIYKKEGEPSADFIPVVAFGRKAEFIEQYVKKGMLILISGPLRNNDYTNKEGAKVYSFQMVAETVEILEKKGTDEEAPTDQDGYTHLDQETEVPFEQQQQDEE